MKKLLDGFTETIRHQQNVLTDPMNGCPDDFAEDYDKANRRTIIRLWDAGATDQQIEEAREKGFELAEKDYEATFGAVSLR